MFERITKIVLLCSLTVGIYLFPTALVYAQKLEVEVLSAEKWIETYGNDTVKTNMKKIKENSYLVNCGNLETVCDKRTQACLKCSYSYKKGWKLFGRTQHDVVRGRCVSQSDYKAYMAQGKLAELFGGDCKKYEGSVIQSELGFDNQDEQTKRYTLDSIFETEYKTEYDSFTGKKDGKKYSMIKYGQMATIIMGGDKENEEFNGCEVLPVKIYNMQSCFFCPLANLIFTTANELTSKAFKSFASSFRIVIAVVFAIWLALAALGQVFPMTKQDAPKFLAGILRQGFKFMLAFFLLVYGSDLFRYFIVPVLDSGLQMGTEIQTVSMPVPEGYKASPSQTDNTYYNLARADGKTLYNRIEEYLASLQARLAYVQAIGTTVFCVGSHKLSIENLITDLAGLKAGLRMMFLGGILTSFSFLLTMAFAFYFMDAILQLAIIGAMIPFMIAGWPFKATAEYASTGFKMLLNTFFAMFFTGFVVSINVELINQSLAFSQSSNSQQEQQAKKEQSAELDAANKETGKGFEQIIEAINSQSWQALDKATEIGGTGFLLLTFCCVFGFKFVSQVTPLAASLAAGVFKNGIASKIGTMAASKIKGMATKAAAPVAKVAGNAALGAVGTVAQKGLSGAGAVAGGAAKLAGKAASAAGMKHTGALLNKVGSAANAVGRGAGKIAKNATESMKKQ